MNSKIYKALILSCAIFVLFALPALADEPQGTKSKSAYNNTQGANAESVYARPGDMITYTLRFQNTTNSGESVMIEDDLTDVLYLSDVVNFGSGSMVGNVLRFPAVSAPAQGRVERSFQVKVKDFPAGTLDTVMSNTYGNGIDIKLYPKIVAGTVAGAYTAASSGTVKGVTYVSPKAGVGSSGAGLLALVLTMGLYLYQRRQRVAVQAGQ